MVDMTTSRRGRPPARSLHGPPARGRLAPPLLACLLACDPAAPPPTDVPEPTAALRPVERRGAVPEAAHVVDYVLDARLDADNHVVAGTARVSWRNRSARSVDSVALHLYMNAFRADDTAWMQEARGTHRGARQGAKEGRWGYIDLKSVKLLGRGAHADFDRLEGVPGGSAELAWQEGADPTVASVALPAPAGPGEKVVMELEFVTKLPEVFARTGYYKDFHMLGQWFPKVGVLAADGTWQAHVFTLNSEFYADFGDYDVHLDVPEAMVVGATGILVAADPPVDGRKKLHYRAEMVHDFAWAADPAFLVYEAEWNDVRIAQLVLPEHAADVPQHLEAVTATLASMEARFGAYPWSTVTVVHPPEDASGAQGMEYPTFFTTSEILRIPWWLRTTGLEERFSGVFTTVHEFGHQYFQGLLASDEWRQPWLDEGMNTAANALVLADWVGEDAWVARIGNQEFTLTDFVRGGPLGDANLDPVDATADTYRAVTSTYAETVYRKTSALMHTLRRLVGPARFDPALRAYCDKWRFRHPTGADLVATLVAELGPRVLLEGTGPGDQPVHLDVAAFLEQGLHSVAAVDFRLDVVRNRRRGGGDGYHRDEHGVLSLHAPDEETDREAPISSLADDEVEGVVVVHRAGEFRVPVTLEVEFADDARERVLWDGEARYRVFTWPGKRVRAARLDPDALLLLEGPRLDNHRATSEAARPDGLSEPLGDLAEELALAALGGLAL